MQLKKWCPSHRFLSVLSSVTESFLPDFPRNTDNNAASRRKNSSNSLSIWRKNNITSILCQYGLFIDTCVSKNAIVCKDAIFYLLWYNMIRWSSHTYKKSSSLSFHSLLFLVNNTKQVTEWNWQSVTQINGMKNTNEWLHG